jgi:hypothetical protein
LVQVIQVLAEDLVVDQDNLLAQAAQATKADTARSKVTMEVRPVLLAQDEALQVAAARARTETHKMARMAALAALVDSGWMAIITPEVVAEATVMQALALEALAAQAAEAQVMEMALLLQQLPEQQTPEVAAAVQGQAVPERLEDQAL